MPRARPASSERSRSRKLDIRCHAPRKRGIQSSRTMRRVRDLAAFRPNVESVEAANSVYSLPPCGGGLGRGVMRRDDDGATCKKIALPPPPTPPHKGEGSAPSARREPELRGKRVLGRIEVRDCQRGRAVIACVLRMIRAQANAVGIAVASDSLLCLACMTPTL